MVIFGALRRSLMYPPTSSLPVCRSVGSENANGGCRMTAWREGSTPAPKLKLGMSNQFFVRDAMGESVFLEGLSNVRIFFVFCAKIDISRKKCRKRRPARIAQCTNVQSAKRSTIEHQTGFRSEKNSPHGVVLRTPGRVGSVGVPTATGYYTADGAPGSVWALWRLQCPFIHIFT